MFARTRGVNRVKNCKAIVNNARSNADSVRCSNAPSTAAKNFKASVVTSLLFPSSQIRVHAKYVNHPVLGDETYGCTPGLFLNSVQRTLGPPAQSKAKQLLATLRRPMLHAKTLG